jgi:hypothetical protein
MTEKRVVWRVMSCGLNGRLTISKVGCVLLLVTRGPGIQGLGEPLDSACSLGKAGEARGFQQPSVVVKTAENEHI